MTLEEMKAQSEARIAEIKRKATEEAEMKRLELVTSGKLDSIYAAKAITAQAAGKIQEFTIFCANIVESTPVYNQRTKETRKFRPTGVYGFGTVVGSLIGLLNGIQYSAAEHKVFMLSHTDLTEQIIEDTLESFGSPAYFSETYGELVPAKPYNVEEAINNLTLIENIFNITIDKSRVTEEQFKSSFELAQIRAETAATNFAVADKLATIDVGE